MYLGLDIGTSSVKAILIDEHQNAIATADAAQEVERPHSGWSQQDPDGWIRGCEQAIGELRAHQPKAFAAIRGIGLSGQMHGAVMLDAQNRPVYPCILWNDSRAAAEAAAMDADPDFRRITGNITFAGFTAPKVVWLAKHEPKAHDRIAQVMLPKDYVRFWLTGVHATEMSDASGIGCLDMANRDWSTTLMEKCGLDIKQLPELFEGADEVAPLREELRNAWGIGQAVAVAAGAADNPAAGCGTGVLEPGTAFVSLGTSGVLFAANGGFKPKAESAVHAFCHAVPHRWYQMGVILSATDSLGWLARLTRRQPGELVQALGDQLRAPARVRFMPYLSGERTPINDAAARGAFTGLDHGSDEKLLTQAVLEGVAFAFKDCQEALTSTGTVLEKLLAVGGGTRSANWLAMIATLLGRPLDVPADSTVGAALGAARLGMIAAEKADPVQVCAPPPIAYSIEPVTALTQAFGDAYGQWRELYPAIKGAGA